MCFTVRPSLLPNLKADDCSFPYTFVTSVFRFFSAPRQKIENAENRRDICCLSNNKNERNRNTSSPKRKTKENHLTLSVTRNHFLWFFIPNKINNDTTEKKINEDRKWLEKLNLLWVSLAFPRIRLNRDLGSALELRMRSGPKARPNIINSNILWHLKNGKNRGRALFRNLCQVDEISMTEQVAACNLN